MWKINTFLLFLFAPFLAIFLVSMQFTADAENLVINVEPVHRSMNELEDEAHQLGDYIAYFGNVVQSQYEVFNRQNSVLNSLTEQSTEYKEMSDDIYEQKILNMLGPTVAAHKSKNNEIKIFKLDELGYRGFIAKIKLFKPNTFKVVLGKDKLGEVETTSEAAKRKGAIFAVNGGGFYYETRDGKKYAQLIGNTVIDGKLVEPFNGYPGNLFFAGINKDGEAIGTVPKTEKDITKLNPYQGVSFIPVLLKDGEKLEIPDEWIETKQPRTIIGKYANDDLIILVIDGRQNDWSSGVTLERLQDKLLELGVKDAYNLDGGGSSAMYFNGEILNKPSDGKERPVVNNIVILP